MKKVKKFFIWLVCVAMLITALPVMNFPLSQSIGIVEEVEAAEITVFRQTDSRWASHKYGYSDSEGTQAATIGSAGCGILSYVNAVYYLNGSFIEPTLLADYSVSNGYRINGVGTAYGLYKSFADNRGDAYGIKYVGHVSTYSDLKNNIQNGNVAIVHVPGHIMAIVDYNSANGTYLLLDSYPSSKRGTYSTGYAWKTEEQLISMNVSEEFYIIGNMSISTCTCSTDYAGNYTCATTSANLTIRSGHGSSYTAIGSIPSGATVYVSKANGSWAHVEYNGVSGYASMEYLQKEEVSEKLVEFHSTSITDITVHDATISTWISNDGGEIFSTGFWFGSDVNDMMLFTSHTHIGWTEFQNSYKISQYYGALSPGITYYYKYYLILQDGMQYFESDLQSFETYGLANVTYQYGTTEEVSYNDAKIDIWTYNSNGYTISSLGFMLGTSPTNMEKVEVNQNIEWTDFHTNISILDYYEKLLPEQTYYYRWYATIDTDYYSDLYAFTTKEEPIKYIISYNANGGTGASSNQTKTHGTNLTLSSTEPTRTGYIFTGWNTKADGSGISYAKGGTYTANANVTLYAQWKINTYTVSYNANGGTGAPTSQTKTYGTNLTLSSTEPTRTGYTFTGWNTKADGSGTSYAKGGTYTANETVILYAQWKKNAADLPFTDVKKGTWQYTVARYVYERNIMTGTSDTKFSPGMALTRGQLVNILWRMEECPSVAYKAAFPDVPNGKYYTSAVLWANSKGIVNGYKTGLFGPSNDVTRQDFIVILYNYARYKGYSTATSGTTYTECSDYQQVSSYAKTAIEWAYERGLIGANGTLNPKGNASRIEAAAMLQRFLEYYGQ